MKLEFINATIELIDEIGLDQITIRKVADKSGYNSATIYNYFENLDHLIFFAAMNNTKIYSNALGLYTKDAKNAMDIFIKVWECFCDYAFDKPEIYNAIFFPKLEKSIEEYIEDYYRFFPEDIIDVDKNISTMLLKRDITKRGETTVLACAEEGYFRYEDIKEINDLTLLIFEGMLKRVIRETVSYDDARNKTMEYIKFVIKGYLMKDYEFYY